MPHRRTRTAEQLACSKEKRPPGGRPKILLWMEATRRASVRSKYAPGRCALPGRLDVDHSSQLPKQAGRWCEGVAARLLSQCPTIRRSSAAHSIIHASRRRPCRSICGARATPYLQNMATPPPAYRRFAVIAGSLIFNPSLSRCQPQLTRRSRANGAYRSSGRRQGT
jgi:hypothetical protein